MNMRLLVGVFLLTVMVGCDKDPPLPPGLGDRIADHEFRVIATPADQFQVGSEVRLRSFRGSPLVIDFWASWCVACLETHELMKELAGAYEGKGVVFLGVLFEDEVAKAQAWLTERGTDYAALEDIGGELAGTFWVSAIPRIIVLGPDGKLVEDALGPFVVRASLEEQLDSLVAGSL